MLAEVVCGVRVEGAYGCAEVKRLNENFCGVGSREWRRGWSSAAGDWRAGRLNILAGAVKVAIVSGQCVNVVLADELRREYRPRFEISCYSGSD